MKVLFAAGHVAGVKVWMGYNEDASMFDLAQRKAKYASEKYGQQTETFYVTKTSYDAVEAACTGCDLASFEHSNADDSIDEPNEPNRVVVYRTVKNPGDGPCLAIGQACADILNTTLSPIQHRANSSGMDWYGVLGRAMRAGCKDAYLIEHGFHTHGPTRAKLSDPTVRQQIAEAEVDAMAQYYGWEDTMIYVKYGDGRETATSSNPAVRSMQECLVKLGIKMISDKEYPPDGRYGTATVNGVQAYKLANKLTGDGQTVDSACLTVMLAQLAALQTGVPQADLDKLATALQTEVERAAYLVGQVATAQGIIDQQKSENLTITNELSAANQYADMVATELSAAKSKIDTVKKYRDAINAM